MVENYLWQRRGVVLEFDKDGNLIPQTVDSPLPTQQFQGIVGLTTHQQYSAGMVSQNNKINGTAQFLIGLAFPWFLVVGFGMIGGITMGIVGEDYDYDEGEIRLKLAEGDGVTTEFSGFEQEIQDLSFTCGEFEIFNWYPTPEPYARQWIEIGAMEQYGPNNYGFDCEYGNDVWLIREIDGNNWNDDYEQNITKIGTIDGDGTYQLSFEDPPPENSSIHYRDWKNNYYEGPNEEELISSLCCMSGGLIFIAAIAVGYAKGFVAFSNGALTSAVIAPAIFFVGCFAMLMMWGF